MTRVPDIAVLIVEDDTRLAALTRTYLEGHGLVVTIAAAMMDGLREARLHPFDIVLLDIALPDGSGLDLCRQIRTFSDMPIIMLTARGEEADRVLGLELGADDYLPKPFSPRELLARIRAQVRRRRGQSGPVARTLEIGALGLDPASRQATLAGTPLDLTGYEFSLLYALASNAGRVLSRDRLMELARGSAEEAFDRSIDVHISHLRAKLGDDSRRPSLIKTVRGVGYVLAEVERP